MQLLVDDFDQAFNLERPHQALSDHATPFEAWSGKPRAAPATPQPQLVEQTRLLSRVADRTGTIAVAHARYHLGREHAATQVNVILGTDELEIFTRSGTHIRTARRGHPGEYIPSGLPRTRRTSQPQ